VQLKHAFTRVAGSGVVRGLVCAVLLAVFGPAALSAQRVNGTLVDADTRAAVGGATVLLVNDAGETVHSTVSDAQGAFTLRAPAAGVYRLQASRIGYRDGTSQPMVLAENGTMQVEMRMSTGTVVLDPLTVTGTPRYARLEAGGFYEREAHFGEQGLREAVFLEQHEIEAMNPFRLEDVFRNVRGVRVVDRQILMRRRNCQPAIVIDGTTVLNGSMPGHGNSASRMGYLAKGEITTPRSLAGVEVYYGTAIPARYMLDSGGCGVIMYWTK
jgi:hypothetical protein